MKRKLSIDIISRNYITPKTIHVSYVLQNMDRLQWEHSHLCFDLSKSSCDISLTGNIAEFMEAPVVHNVT